MRPDSRDFSVGTVRAFLGARIGLEGDRSGADSILVRGDTIRAVGRRDEIEAALSPSAEKVSLGGGVLLPGFHDAHVHLCHEGRYAMRPALGTSRSLGEALAMMADRAKRSADAVLFAEGFDESAWPDGRIPTREQLDRIEARRPLIARRVCGHIAVANGAALAAIPEGTAGVDRPSGRLEEDVVFRLEQDFFPPTEEEDRASIVLAQENALSMGVTTVHEIDIPGVLRAYRSLDEEGALKLSVRFFVHAPIAEAAALRGGAAGRNVGVAGAKIFLDGSIGGCTAAVNEPYRSGGRGELLLDVPQIVARFTEADRLALPLAVHAIGDRALEAAVEAEEIVVAKRKRAPGETFPPRRLEHAEMLSVGVAERAHRLGMLLSMQPNFQGRWGVRGGLYEKRLGKERTAALNRAGTWIRSGYPVAFGSDAMPFDPFYGIESALNHPVPTERIPLVEAVRAFTEEGALFAPSDPPSGRLVPGTRADFLWFDRIPPPGEPLRREDLRFTVSGGRTVHER